MNRALVAAGLIASLASTPVRAAAQVSAAIDADVWVPVAASVASGDIVAMGRVYHPQAVLVSRNGTQPIRDALVGWGKGIEEQRRTRTRATVEFRFSMRQDNGETAFETGMFKYTEIAADGTPKPGYTRMEALLVKHEGKWRIMMERQLETVTEAAWNALPR